MSVRILSHLDTYPIRRAVLWPQKTLAQVALPEDPDGLHFGKFSQDDQLIGVISVFSDNNILQFKKLAVLKSHQAQGVGSVLLNEVKKVALFNHSAKVICDARQAAVPFYLKHGFVVEFTFLKYEKMYSRMGFSV